MTRTLTLLVAMLVFAMAGFAQTDETTLFPESIDPGDFNPTSVVLPQSPFSLQVLFIGGYDTVQTRQGPAIAKQWHDFIGFTPDDNSSDLGWVSVNHERIQADDLIGDGGGMTVFKVKRNADGTIGIVDQTLSDGRSGTFFNVDFAGTVGETGMNCGGITSAYDGRIWTAEEWFRTSTASIYAGGAGVRDTLPWTISTDIPGDFDGSTIDKYQNFNYMVEIDPKEAEAVRKQYNWGRQGFEGGIVMPDNQTVYLGEDGRPGLFSKFVADTPGDFTHGDLFVYGFDEASEAGEWIQIDNSVLDNMLNMSSRTAGAYPWKQGAAMFDRLEWVAQHDGKVYFTETGNDGFWDEFYDFRDGDPRRLDPDYNGKIDNHWLEAARIRFPHLAAVSNDSVRRFLLTANDDASLGNVGKFIDAHGRVLVYDPATNLVSVFLEGGPYPGDANRNSAALDAGYPVKHLTNPDGLNFISPEGTGKTFMIIMEDLNGTSFNRTPAGVSNRTCELYALDMDITNPTIDDLIRVSIVPVGAEVTGGQGTADGHTLFVNSQHPSSNNPFPYNNSLTYAINGWDKLAELAKARVAGLAVYDADTDAKITDIKSGDVIEIDDLDDLDLAFVAEMDPYSINGSVNIHVMGPAIDNSQTENVAPYASFKDAGGNFFGKTLVPGEYTVVVTPNDGRNRSGNDGIARTYKFTLVNKNAVVESFKLYDANTDMEIATITEGATIPVSNLSSRKLTIVAEMKAGSGVESVEVLLTGRVRTGCLENHEPYALYGDRSGDFIGRRKYEGDYTVRAIPYSQNNRRGSRLSPSRVNFSISDASNVANNSSRLSFDTEFVVYPNPVVSSLNFNKQVSVAIYNELGQRVAVYEAVRQINVDDFRSKLAGNSFFVMAQGEERAVRVVLE